jgi:hypothetical protein
MVTATGLLLGFTLGFAGTWYESENAVATAPGILIGACVVTGTLAMIAVLFRILNNDYPRAAADRYYAKTLKLLIFGVCITFAAVFVDMAVTLMALDP